MIAAGQNVIANRMLQPGGINQPTTMMDHVAANFTPEQQKQLQALVDSGYGYFDALRAVRSGTAEELTKPKIYSPDVKSAFEDTRRWQQKYEDAISKGIDPLEIP